MSTKTREIWTVGDLKTNTPIVSCLDEQTAIGLARAANASTADGHGRYVGRFQVERSLLIGNRVF